MDASEFKEFISGMLFLKRLSDEFDRKREEEARRLILKTFYDLGSSELSRYLNAEKRALIAVVENLWDKYAVSSQELEIERSKTLKELDGFLKGLGYLVEA